MNKIFFMVMRRMRTPLLVLLAAYTIALLGMNLVPGVDADGKPWRMDFFHAYYFVSYMATTIGFGEIPHEFSAAQRAWVTFSLYITVIAWFYALGSILTLIQDTAFRRAIVENRFASQVRRMGEPFYLICGFGDTGKALVQSLSDYFIHAVVIDSNCDDIHFLSLQNFTQDVYGICADAAMPHNLLRAGLSHPQCLGVVALTNNEAVNLKVAITSKPLNPPLPVICRGETHQYEANMASFGTDHIIDPFTTFADQIAMAIEKPGLFLLANWLTKPSEERISEPIFPPKGTWIVCGFGRLGKAVYKQFKKIGLKVVVIESNPESTQCPVDSIVGWGTEACTLQDAGIESAVGLIAGTEIDANNLSIVMTAHELNPNLFTIMRQNRSTNKLLFQSIKCDLVIEPSDIIATRVWVLLTMPLLQLFLAEAAKRENQWANQVASRILAISGDTLPMQWVVEISAAATPAVCTFLARNARVVINDLRRNPRNRKQRFFCFPLMIIRDEKPELMPDDGKELQIGDRVLFCGRQGIKSSMEWLLNNEKALHYVLTGDEMPDGYLWRWLQERKKARTLHGG